MQKIAQIQTGNHTIKPRGSTQSTNASHTATIPGALLIQRLGVFILAAILFANGNVFALTVGNRIKAAAGGANVRDAALTTIVFAQDGGVHGTITAGPVVATAGGFTGNWFKINWDSQPPNQGTTQGWSAESVIALAPTAGDVTKPSFTTSFYRSANIFWQAGFAPASTSPPNPQLGSALGNCTWYAHGRLRQLGYNTVQLNKMTSNANQWDDQAAANGITVNTIPAVGAIAQSDAQNHVAVVESINNDGSITISESSYVLSTSSTWNLLFRHRTVSPTWFSKFIHVSKTSACTATLSGPSSGSTVTFPATFAWNSACTVRLAFASTANPTTVQITGPLSGSGIITAAEWAGIANALGAASSYYWTVGTLDGSTFTPLATWRAFYPQSAITMITPTPADGTVATINQNLQLRVDVKTEAISSGVLQVWVYDAGFATSQMDWKYISSAQSTVAVFNNLNLSRSVAGARDYTIYVQFRPGATSGPILSTGINDIISSEGYRINWQNPPDTTAPTVTITSPTSNPTHATTISTLNLGGSANDNVGVSQVNWTSDRGGSGTAQGTTSWTINGIALQSGVNVITAVARDSAGNTSTDTISVTYTPPDTTLPTVTITSPTSNPTYSTAISSVNLGGSASDNIGVNQVSWINNQGGSGICSGTTSWVINGIPLQSGANIITVTSQDSAGNTAVDTITVTFNPPDTTPPSISIASPTSSPSFVTNNPVITLSGSASDNVGITGFHWQNDRGGSGTVSGTTAWNVNVALQNGVNVITVTARDSAGNSASDIISITYVPAEPISPKISSARLVGTVFTLSVPSELGRTYTLEYKNSLTANLWQTAESKIGNGGPLILTDPAAFSPSRFYRVKVN